MSNREHDRFEESYRSPREETMAELFAEATARLEAGDPLDEILAGVPAAHRAEVRAMLTVSEILLAGQQVPVPARSAQRRAEQRALFMAEAARTHQEFLATNAAKSPAAGTARPTPHAEETGLIGLIVLTWRTLQEAFALRPYRLAPLMLTLLLSFGIALGITRVADAAVPGDLAYSLKGWVNRMNLTFAPPDAAAEVQAQVTAEFAQDLARAAERTRNTPAQVDLNSLVVQETAPLIFEGFMGNGVLKFGDVLVMPNFQPDANSSGVQPMTISGDLVPGATVQVTMRILPGQREYVQGVSAYVLAPPLAQAATPAPVRGEQPAAPAPPPPTVAPCLPYMPGSWGVYTVQPGDTLSGLALITGTPIYTIVGANCLDSDVIRIGQTLYLPSAPAPQPTPLPTVEPPIVPTVEPTPEPTIWPTVEPPTVEPPTVEPPTVEPTAWPTLEPTPEPTIWPTAEPTIAPPTVEPTAQPPTAEPPTVEPPTIEPPTIEPPTIEPPTAEPPTAEPPTAEPPTAEPLPTDPVVSPGGAEATATSAPIVSSPAAPEPTPAPPEPTAQPPTAEPPAAPTVAPTVAPLDLPTAGPAGNASGTESSTVLTAVGPLAAASTIAPSGAPAATPAARSARRRGNARPTRTPTITPTPVAAPADPGVQDAGAAESAAPPAPSPTPAE